MSQSSEEKALSLRKPASGPHSCLCLPDSRLWQIIGIPAAVSRPQTSDYKLLGTTDLLHEGGSWWASRTFKTFVCNISRVLAWDLASLKYPMLWSALTCFIPFKVVHPELSIGTDNTVTLICCLSTPFLEEDWKRTQSQHTVSNEIYNVLSGVATRTFSPKHLACRSKRISVHSRPALVYPVSSKPSRAT